MTTTPKGVTPSTREDNTQYVASVKSENTGVNLVTGIFGAIHFGLVLAAEAVSCAEAKVVEGMTKNTDNPITYRQMRDYRDITTTVRVMKTKDKVREVQSKFDKALAEAKAKAKGNVQPQPQTS